MSAGNILFSYRTPELGLGTNPTFPNMVGYQKYEITTTGIKLVSSIGATDGIVDRDKVGDSQMAMVQIEASGLVDESLAVRYRQDATLVSATDGFILGNLEQIFLNNTIEMQNTSFISIDGGATIFMHIQFFKQ
jgi:hypothetical protein